MLRSSERAHWSGKEQDDSKSKRICGESNEETEVNLYNRRHNNQELKGQATFFYISVSRSLDFKWTFLVDIGQHNQGIPSWTFGTFHPAHKLVLVFNRPLLCHKYWTVFNEIMVPCTRHVVSFFLCVTFSCYLRTILLKGFSWVTWKGHTMRNRILVLRGWESWCPIVIFSANIWNLEASVFDAFPRKVFFLREEVKAQLSTNCRYITLINKAGCLLPGLYVNKLDTTWH